MKTVLILCMIHVAWSKVTYTADGPIVEAPAGKVQGYTQDVFGKSVDTFLGIPYAEPPIGDLRFQRPMPLRDPWTGLKKAKKYPPACYQIYDMAFGRPWGVEMWNPNHNISEDCLYLNIWTPKARTPSELLPVMIWIYGGGFMLGTSTLDVYEGRYLPAEKNVIVASMQYRLGVFGFMYMGKDPRDSPGNMGLIDQSLAIKWIKKNIQAFGGDPNRMTLFGESAGAASVSYQLLSPLSMDNYQYAILESGSALAGWAHLKPEKAFENSLKLAKLLNCKDEDKKEIMKCLRKLPPNKLSDQSWLASSKPILNFPFTPTTDYYFISKSPIEIVRDSEMKRTKILMGSNKDEGNYFILYGLENYYPLHGKANLTQSEFVESVKKVLQAYDNSISTNKIIQQSVLFEYQESVLKKDRGTYSDIVDDIIGDANFICPVISFADYYLRNGLDVYMYRFMKRSTNNPWPEWMGVLHGYEIEYIFGLPLNTTWKYGPKDIEVSKKMMTYWTNFAKTGDPNKESESDKGLNEWPKYTMEKKEFVYLDDKLPPVRTGQAPRTRNCAFWNQYMPQLQSYSREIQKMCGAGSIIKSSVKMVLLSILISISIILELRLLR